MAADSFTCPRCGMTSYHPDDVREGYCARCHDWTGERAASGGAMSARGTRCGIHGLELEEVRPGKWLCPEPECTHITTDAQMAKVREMLWAQEHGMVHPEAMIIGSEEERDG